VESPQPLTGEHLALDLVNTHPVSHDLLSTPQALRAWLVLQRDRLEVPSDAEARITSADLREVQHVRDHVARVIGHLRAGRRPAASSVNAINAARGKGPLVPELRWRQGAIVQTRRRPGPLGDRLAAWLADAAGDLLSGADMLRVRECEADDCTMLFVPRHPGRRWCDPARCGNRVRVARHYRRSRAGE